MKYTGNKYEIFNNDVLECLQNENIGVVDTVITSPPYNCGIKYDGYSDDRGQVEYFDWIEQVACRVSGIVAPGGYAVWNVPNYIGSRGDRVWALEEYKAIFSRYMPFEDLIIWKKQPPSGMAWGCPPFRPRMRADHEWLIVTHAPGGERYETGVSIQDWSRWTRSVWDIPSSSHTIHPATFPHELARRLVMLYSPEKGTVLDPFCGTGTTLRAAIDCGRRAIGIEQSATYCNVAESRCSQGLLFEKGVCDA